MNLLLLENQAERHSLPTGDAKATHILKVLKRAVGDSFDVGCVNGPRGKATITAIDATGALTFIIAWGALPSPPPPVILGVGLPRPQTARKILFDASCLGVREIHFFRSEKGEPSYAQSNLWTGGDSGEWRSHLIAGAEQAFTTWIPTVCHFSSLSDWLAHLPTAQARIALDNYEAPAHLHAANPTGTCILAVGSERGWSASERTLLRESHFTLAHLGDRVLRTETACIAGLTLVLPHYTGKVVEFIQQDVSDKVRHTDDDTAAAAAKAVFEEHPDLFRKLLD